MYPRYKKYTERSALSAKGWAERQKSRITEVGAVNKALAVLTSDEARDHFSDFYKIPTKISKHIQQTYIDYTSVTLTIQQIY